MNLQGFLVSPYHNAWLKIGPMEVYVRKSWHLIEGLGVATFDIANVTVQMSHQRQGHFTRFLNDAESRVPVVYVEHVIPVFLQMFLKRRGYTIVGDYQFMPSFFRRTENALRTD